MTNPGEVGGTGTYLDGLDDRDAGLKPWTPPEPEIEPVPMMPETEPEVEVPAAGPPPALGVTVDMGVHGEAFRRKSYGNHYVPGTDLFAANERTWKWPEPPEVPCRDALPEEIPDSASTAAGNARAAGRDVRVTYARSGEARRSDDKGKCSCGAVVRIYKETGFVFPHKTPDQPEKVACDGDALNWLQVCVKCGQKAKTLKSGGLSKHYLKTEPVTCPNVESPAEVVPGEPLPGRSSVVVRVKGVGVGVWVEGKFSAKDSWLLDGRGGVVPAGSEEFRAACKGER